MLADPEKPFCEESLDGREKSLRIRVTLSSQGQDSEEGDSVLPLQLAYNDRYTNKQTNKQPFWGTRMTDS